MKNNNIHKQFSALIIIALIAITAVPFVHGLSNNIGITVENSQSQPINQIPHTGSITPQNIADITGIERENIDIDINTMYEQGENSNQLTFPGKILIFTATTEDDSIELVRGYIGSIKKASLRDGMVESSEILYRGRVNLEIADQSEVESYLIVDGSEVEYIYGLIPIVNGEISTSEPIAKLLLKPQTNEAMLSFGNNRGTVNLDLTSIERRILRPAAETFTIESLGNIQNEITSQDSRPNLNRRSNIFTRIANFFSYPIFKTIPNNLPASTDEDSSPDLVPESEGIASNDISIDTSDVPRPFDNVPQIDITVVDSIPLYLVPTEILR